MLQLKLLDCVSQLLLLSLALCLSACGQPQFMELQGSTMGTSYNIKLPRPAPSLNRSELQTKVDELLASINAEMSTYDPDSSLSVLNQGPAQQWQTVPQRLMQVLRAAQDVYHLSSGLFDPTVGPLVNLWGFGPQGPVEFPTEASVRAIRAQVGYDRLELAADANRVRKRGPDLYVDLSAIAKGFAVDQLAELLERFGAVEYLVEVGGELRVKGNNPQGKPWRVAVETPVAGQRQVHGVLSLQSAAIATSGDYRNFFTHEGKRFSHTIDPRTGYPVTHNLVSVTVVDNSAMRADALATALLVMGPESGMLLAGEHGLAVWMIVQKEGQLVDLRSPAIEAYRVH